MEHKIPAPRKPLAPIFFLDGGLGTTLKDEYNVEVDGRDRPLWSSHLLISDPATILQVQTDFASAGADVVITATYQASFEGFALTRAEKPEYDSGNGRGGIGEEAAEGFMRSAVAIARRSFQGKIGERGKVALSLGAYGAIMVPSQEYSGRYDTGHRSVQQLAEWHGKRLEVFRSDEKTWGEVDLVAFETVPLLAEIEAAREVMEMAEKPFWISCVFPGDDLCLPDGSSVDVIVDAMLKGERVRPDAVGLNCTKIEKVAGLLERFEGAVGKLVGDGDIEQWPALVLYPDGTKGEVYNTTTHEWKLERNGNDDSASWDELMFNIVRQTRAKGLWSAIYVGGCCKTTPSMIKSLEEKIHSLPSYEI